MIGDLNEAHFALHCVAVQISELHGRNHILPMGTERR